MSAEQLAEIAALLNSGDGLDGKEPGLVSIVESLLILLLAAGLAMKIVLSPGMVGIHPKNRYGMGLVVSNVHKLGAAFHKAGFSFIACEEAVCIADDASREIAKFTRTIQNGSEHLGKSGENEVVAGAIACTHTNQWLLAAEQGVKTDVPELQDHKGCIDTSKIKMKSPNHVQACAQGITWIMIKAEAVQQFPSLPNVIMKGRQLVGQVQNRESQVELLMGMHTLAMQSSGLPDWEQVKKIVAETESHHKSDIPALVNFRKYFSGGKFMERLQTFVSLSVPSERSASRDFIQGLCDKGMPASKDTSKSPMIFLVHAFLKSQLAAPDDKCQGQLSRLHPVSDLKYLNTELGKTCEDALKDLWGFEDKLDQKQTVTIIGEAETYFPWILCKRTDCANGMKEIGDVLYGVYEKLKEADIVTDNPWARFAPNKHHRLRVGTRPRSAASLSTTSVATL